MEDKGSKVEVRISLRGVALQKKAAFVVVKRKRDGQWVEEEKSRTEPSADNAVDTNFAFPLRLKYFATKKQEMKLELYCLKAGGKDVTGALASYDYYGEWEGMLSDVMTAPGMIFMEPLAHSKGTAVKGWVMLTGIQVTDEVVRGGNMQLTLACKGVEKPSTFTKPDPFLMLLAKNESNGSFEAVWATEPCRSTQDPTFQLISVPVWTLCRGNKGAELKLWLMQWNDSGKEPTVIGEILTTVDSLVATSTAAKDATPVPIAWLRKDKKVGELIVRKAETVPSPFGKLSKEKDGGAAASSAPDVPSAASSASSLPVGAPAVEAPAGGKPAGGKPSGPGPKPSGKPAGGKPGGPKPSEPSSAPSAEIEAGADEAGEAHALAEAVSGGEAAAATAAVAATAPSEKPVGGKPAGGKPSGGKPGGAPPPSGGKPGGSKPTGGKPPPGRNSPLGGASGSRSSTPGGLLQCTICNAGPLDDDASAAHAMETGHMDFAPAAAGVGAIAPAAAAALPVSVDAPAASAEGSEAAPAAAVAAVAAVDNSSVDARAGAGVAVEVSADGKPASTKPTGGKPGGGKPAGGKPTGSAPPPAGRGPPPSRSGSPKPQNGDDTGTSPASPAGSTGSGSGRALPPRKGTPPPMAVAESTDVAPAPTPAVSDEVVSKEAVAETGSAAASAGSDKPEAAKPGGGKPPGGKPVGGKPGGAKPATEKGSPGSRASTPGGVLQCSACNAGPLDDDAAAAHAMETGHMDFAPAAAGGAPAPAPAAAEAAPAPAAAPTPAPVDTSEPVAEDVAKLGKPAGGKPPGGKPGGAPPSMKGAPPSGKPGGAKVSGGMPPSGSGRSSPIAGAASSSPAPAPAPVPEPVPAQASVEAVPATEDEQVATATAAVVVVEQTAPAVEAVEPVAAAPAAAKAVSRSNSPALFAALQSATSLFFCADCGLRFSSEDEAMAHVLETGHGVSDRAHTPPVVLQAADAEDAAAAQTQEQAAAAEVQQVEVVAPAPAPIAPVVEVVDPQLVVVAELPAATAVPEEVLAEKPAAEAQPETHAEPVLQVPAAIVTEPVAAAPAPAPEPMKACEPEPAAVVEVAKAATAVPGKLASPFLKSAAPAPAPATGAGRFSGLKPTSSAGKAGPEPSRPASGGSVSSVGSNGAVGVGVGVGSKFGAGLKPVGAAAAASSTSATAGTASAAPTGSKFGPAMLKKAGDKEGGGGASAPPSGRVEEESGGEVPAHIPAPADTPAPVPVAAAVTVAAPSTAPAAPAPIPVEAAPFAALIANPAVAVDPSVIGVAPETAALQVPLQAKSHSPAGRGVLSAVTASLTPGSSHSNAPGSLTSRGVMASIVASLSEVQEHLIALQAGSANRERDRALGLSGLAGLQAQMSLGSGSSPGVGVGGGQGYGYANMIASQGNGLGIGSSYRDTLSGVPGLATTGTLATSTWGGGSLAAAFGTSASPSQAAHTAAEASGVGSMGSVAAALSPRQERPLPPRGSQVFGALQGAGMGSGKGTSYASAFTMPSLGGPRYMDTGVDSSVQAFTVGRSAGATREQDKGAGVQDAAHAPGAGAGSLFAGPRVDRAFDDAATTYSDSAMRRRDYLRAFAVASSSLEEATPGVGTGECEKVQGYGPGAAGARATSLARSMLAMLNNNEAPPSHATGGEGQGQDGNDLIEVSEWERTLAGLQDVAAELNTASTPLLQPSTAEGPLLEADVQARSSSIAAKKAQGNGGRARSMPGTRSGRSSAPVSSLRRHSFYGAQASVDAESPVVAATSSRLHLGTGTSLDTSRAHAQAMPEDMEDVSSAYGEHDAGFEELRGLGFGSAVVSAGGAVPRSGGETATVAMLQGFVIPGVAQSYSPYAPYAASLAYERIHAQASEAGLLDVPSSPLLEAARARLSALRAGHAAALFGLPVAQVLHSSHRSTVLALRQDLAQLRQMLSTAVKEAAAVEYDVAGVRGASFGDESTGPAVIPRAQLVDDMPVHTLSAYARQASSLMQAVERNVDADGAVGLAGVESHMAAHAPLIDSAAGDATAALLAEGRRSLAELQLQLREMEGAVASKRAEAEAAEAARNDTQAAYLSIKATADDTRACSSAELSNAAGVLAQAEGLVLVHFQRAQSASGQGVGSLEVTEEELCTAGFDDSDSARERRLRRAIDDACTAECSRLDGAWSARLASQVEANAAALAAACAEGESALSSAAAAPGSSPSSSSSAHAVPLTEGEVRAILACVDESREGEEGHGPSLDAALQHSGLRSAAQTAHLARSYLETAIEESAKEGDAIIQRISEREGQLANVLQAISEARAVYDLKVTVRRMWALRGVKPSACNAFLADALRSAPFSSALALRLHEAYRAVRAGYTPSCTPLELQLWGEGMPCTAGSLVPQALTAPHDVYAASGLEVGVEGQAAAAHSVGPSGPGNTTVTALLGRKPAASAAAEVFSLSEEDMDALSPDERAAVEVAHAAAAESSAAAAAAAEAALERAAKREARYGDIYRQAAAGPEAAAAEAAAAASAQIKKHGAAAAALGDGDEGGAVAATRPPRHTSTSARGRGTEGEDLEPVDPLEMPPAVASAAQQRMGADALASRATASARAAATAKADAAMRALAAAQAGVREEEEEEDDEDLKGLFVKIREAASSGRLSAAPSRSSSPNPAPAPTPASVSAASQARAQAADDAASVARADFYSALSAPPSRPVSPDMQPCLDMNCGQRGGAAVPVRSSSPITQPSSSAHTLLAAMLTAEPTYAPSAAPPPLASLKSAPGVQLSLSAAPSLEVTPARPPLPPPGAPLAAGTGRPGVQSAPLAPSNSRALYGTAPSRPVSFDKTGLPGTTAGEAFALTPTVPAEDVDVVARYRFLDLPPRGSQAQHGSTGTGGVAAQGNVANLPVQVQSGQGQGQEQDVIPTPSPAPTPALYEYAYQSPARVGEAYAYTGLHPLPAAPPMPWPLTGAGANPAPDRPARSPQGAVFPALPAALPALNSPGVGHGFEGGTPSDPVARAALLQFLQSQINALTDTVHQPAPAHTHAASPAGRLPSLASVLASAPPAPAPLATVTLHRWELGVGQMSRAGLASANTAAYMPRGGGGIPPPNPAGMVLRTPVSAYPSSSSSMAGHGLGSPSPGLAYATGVVPLGLGSGELSRYPAASPRFQYGSSAMGRALARDAFNTFDKRAAYQRRGVPVAGGQATQASAGRNGSAAAAYFSY